jgi:hypothetical protein
MARPTDPLRGVTPGRLDVPGVRSSGISATVGLVAVIAVLLVAGVLVVGGDSVLRRGGTIIFGGADGSPDPGATRTPGSTPGPGSSAPPPSARPAQIGTATDFSCETVEIRDPERSRWRLADVDLAVGDGFEQVKVSLRRASDRRQAGTVRTAWMTPEQAVERYEIPRPAGSRVLALTFTGNVQLDSDRTLDASDADAKGLENVRSVQVTTDPDGKTVAVVGIAGDGCARLSAPRWKKKGEDQRADVLLDVQTS